jgi:hypothetical protein
MSAFAEAELAGPLPDPSDDQLPDVPFEVDSPRHVANLMREDGAPRYWAKVYEFPGGMTEISATRMSVDDLNKFDACQHKPRGRSKAAPDPRNAEESKAVSVRRARRQVRHVTKALQADHLLTLTYRENMQDVERLKKDWAQFLRSVTARYPDWKFVCVREHQQRGAFHIHAAVVGHQNVNFLRISWRRVVGEDGGNIDVRGPRRRWGSGGYKWKASRLSSYLCKYISKDFETSEHHSKRYWRSKGIEVPKPMGMWLRATEPTQALAEACALGEFFGMSAMRVWTDPVFKHIWIGGGG